VKRRKVDGHWTELIKASRRMHKSIQRKATQAITSTITPTEKEDLQSKLHELKDSLLTQQELFAIEAIAVETNPVDIQVDTWKEEEVPCESVTADIDGTMKQHDLKSWTDTQPANDRESMKNGAPKSYVTNEPVQNVSTTILANADQTNEDQTTNHTNHTHFNTASTKVVPTLTQNAVSTIYNLQPDQTVTEFQPIVHVISVEKLSTNCKRRVVTVSDGKYTIKGYLHFYHPDTCGNIIRVTNYQVKTSILDGSLFININDYDTMGTYDKPMESTPFNINRVEKWNLIMDLAKSNPFTYVNAMIHDRQQDLDYSSKHFTTLYKFQDQISLLRT
jgi:hypothetical protein